MNTKKGKNGKMLGIETNQLWGDSCYLLSTKLGVKFVNQVCLLYPPQLLAYLLNECTSPQQFTLNQCGLGKEVTYIGLQLCARHCWQFV